MEGKNSDNSDVLFALWSKKVAPSVCKLSKEYIDVKCPEEELLRWWDNVGKHQKKSKHDEIIEALNFIRYTKLHELATCVVPAFNNMESKNAENAQKSEAKIQDLKTQIDKLLSELLALNEKYKNHKETIADLKAKLNAKEHMSFKMLKSVETKKNVHFLEEVTSSESETFSSENANAQESVPISVLRVMAHGHENPQTPGEHSKLQNGKESRLCSSCHKIGHLEEKCWSLGRGRPPPYILKNSKTLSKSKNQQSARTGKTLSELTALFMQGLQLLTSLASGLLAQ